MSRYPSLHGAFHIDPMPGQPQVAHCHSFFIQADKRHQGHGTAMKRLQMFHLQSQQYDYATCTIDASNDAQRQVLIKNGWRRLDGFSNSRTGGQTELWGRDVPKDEAWDVDQRQTAVPAVDDPVNELGV